MHKRNPSAPRETAEELAALIHMTRFISDSVDRLVADPDRLKRQLNQLEAELQSELHHADPTSLLAKAN